MKKNEKEKQIIYEWAKNNSAGYCFQEIDGDKESYFVQRDECADKDVYIKEYGFETLPELIRELDVLWDGDEAMKSVKKAVEVAVFKNKPSKAVQEGINAQVTNEKEEKLPEFIYNF